MVLTSWLAKNRSSLSYNFVSQVANYMKVRILAFVISIYGKSHCMMALVVLPVVNSLRAKENRAVYALKYYLAITP